MSTDKEDDVLTTVLFTLLGLAVGYKLAYVLGFNWWVASWRELAIFLYFFAFGFVWIRVYRFMWRPIWEKDPDWYNR